MRLLRALGNLALRLHDLRVALSELCPVVLAGLCDGIARRAYCVLAAYLPLCRLVLFVVFRTRLLRVLVDRLRLVLNAIHLPILSTQVGKDNARTLSVRALSRRVTKVWACD